METLMMNTFKKNRILLIALPIILLGLTEVTSAKGESDIGYTPNPTGNPETDGILPRPIPKPILNADGSSLGGMAKIKPIKPALRNNRHLPTKKKTFPDPPPPTCHDTKKPC